MTNLSTRTMTRIMAPSRGDVRDWMHIFREYDGDNLVFVENEIKKKVNLADVISYAAIEYNDEALLEVPPCALFPNTYDALVSGITDVPLDIELDVSFEVRLVS